MDFGNVFDGNDRWLQIDVRPGKSSGPYTTLIPRQKITPTPYAMYAQTSGSVVGGITGSGIANYIAKFTGPNTVGNSVIYESTGNVGIGTTAPGAKLEVAGQIKITGGTPGADKVLTCNASGLASWQNLQVIPGGVIVMWSGSIGSIPSGWALCDGDNNTPDLRDRFIVGAGSSYGVGSTGGEATHTLTTTEMPSHTHNGGTFAAGSAGAHTHTYNNYLGMEHSDDGEGAHSPTMQTVSTSTGSAGAHTHAISGVSGSIGGGGVHENRPPYYALAYIMKL